MFVLRLLKHVLHRALIFETNDRTIEPGGEHGSYRFQNQVSNLE